MSFLGGVSLGSAADRQRQALTRELELRRSLLAVEFSPAGGYLYRGGSDLVLRHGTFRMGRATPPVYAHLRGPMSGCFQTAWRAAQAEVGLSYWEGWLAVGSGIPIYHGWCVAPDDGVVELTIPDTPHRTVRTPNLLSVAPEHCAYWGVELHCELVAQHVRRYDQFGLLDRSPAEAAELRGHFDEEPPTHGYPILKVPYDPGRAAL